jgi:hypothetical protein
LRVSGSKTPLEAETPALLGTPFLAYIANASEAEVDRYLANEDGLNESQRAVIAQALDLGHQILSQELGLRTPATSLPFSSADALARLCTYIPDVGSGLATFWRVAAGGTVPVFETEDPVEDQLLTLARDFYPVLLLPHPAPDPFARNPFPITHSRLGFDHPATERLLATLGDDEPLRALFPPGPIEKTTAARNLMSRSGRGGTTQAGFLVTTLLANAEPRAWATGKLTLDDYLLAARTELAAARSLATGEEALVTAAIGLQSVNVPEGLHLDTPWGLMREPDPWQKRWAPVGADLVLETPFPMAIDVRDWDPDGEPRFPGPEFFEPRMRLDQTLNQLRLALLLSSDPAAPRALVTTWSFVPDPLQMPGFQWNVDQSRLLQTGITEEEAPEIRRWMSLVSERYDGKLDLATRRLLSALSNRMNGEDGLVDATIALESLLGSRPAGRIRTHLAKALNSLLGGDSEERDSCTRLVRQIYDRRKDIVHGGHLDPTEAEEARTAAARLVMEAMAALLSELPDLILDDSRGEKLARGTRPSM